MNNQMITSSTTLSQLLKRVDLISNNIANVNTTGYKSQNASFHDIFQQVNENHRDKDKEVGRTTPNGIAVGLGAKVASVNFSHELGSIKVTNRNLDMMINGNWGYFRVQHASNDEVNFTRNGEFTFAPNPNVDGEVMITTANGHALLDTNDNPISFTAPAKDIAVSSAGLVSIIDGNGAEQNFQISIAKINRPELLEEASQNNFKLTGNQNELLENGTLEFIDLQTNSTDDLSIQQGALEMSNVNLTDEMTNLMLTQRMIQFQGRSISMADQMMGIANNIRG